MIGFFAMGCFAVGHFAVGHFAVRTVHLRDPCMQHTEENIAKYAVDANLFQLGSTNRKKRYPAPGCFLVSLPESVPR